MGPTRFTFTIHKSMVLNSNAMPHHMVKAKIVRFLRSYGFEVFAEPNGGEAYNEPVFDTFEIEAVICPPTRRRLDPPNLYPTVKALIDAGSVQKREGYIGCGLWDDDDWTHLSKLSFSYGGLSGIKDTFVIHFQVKPIG